MSEQARPEAAEPVPDVKMEEIVALCKRRGFIFPSSEIYGGLGSTYDYGHYGVLLKTNVKNEWWRSMLTERDDIVALDSAILQHPKVWEASGPPGGLYRPAGRLQELQAALPRRPRRSRGAVPGEGEPAEDRGPPPRAHRGAPVQPDVRDDRRPGQGDRIGRLPSPRDGAGHLHQLQERPPVRAQEAAVRYRPGRQVLPQRDHAGELHLSDPRVRADGDGVLRPARLAGEWYEHWIGERYRWYTELGIRPDFLRVRPHDVGRALPLLVGHKRRRVPVPDRLVRAGGNRQPRQLRPHPARQVTPARSSSTSTSSRASATCPT